jgi:DNA polymerase
VRAEELLRRYLEQRREMGERELVLDDLTVEQVMQLIGAARADAPTRAAGEWREALTAAGVTAPAAKPIAPAARASESAAPAPIAPAEPIAPGIIVGGDARELFGGGAKDAATLDDIATLVAACTACVLYKAAKNPVPGDGRAGAELMCIGEGPGASEDETGHPFVGQAGQLLTKILEAIQLKRDDVYIANVVKHRPPGNRTPAPDEVKACMPFLVRQIELVKGRCPARPSNSRSPQRRVMRSPIVVPRTRRKRRLR